MITSQKNFLDDLSTIKDAIQKVNLDTTSIDKLHEEISNMELLIPVVGEFSAGKSSLLNSFIGKDVYVKLLEGHADGVVKEVTDNGVVIENKDGLQIVNLEYVLKVREYPYKNGKRALVLDE